MFKRFHTIIESIDRKDNTEDGNPVFNVVTKDGSFQTSLNSQVSHFIDEDMAGQGAVLATKNNEIFNMIIDPNWDTQEAQIIVENNEEVYHLTRILDRDELQALITESAEEWGVKASNVDTEYIYRSIHNQ